MGSNRSGKLEVSKKRLAGGLVEYLFDIALIGFAQWEAQVVEVDVVGIQLSHKVSLNGEAPVDADERAKFIFIQQVTQGGQDMIFPLGGDDGGIVPEGFEVEDIV